jgi:hypothetical protein
MRTSSDFETGKTGCVVEAEAHVSLNKISGCYPQIDSPSGHDELENVTDDKYISNINH